MLQSSNIRISSNFSHVKGKKERDIWGFLTCYTQIKCIYCRRSLNYPTLNKTCQYFERISILLIEEYFVLKLRSNKAVLKHCTVQISDFQFGWFLLWRHVWNSNQKCMDSYGKSEYIALYKSSNITVFRNYAQK